MAKKKDKTKKKIEIDRLSKISSNKILIRVYKDFGSNTAILKAEYEAEERRDAYNNLISINKEYLHDEDTDFGIDDVYHDMQVLLEFKNKEKKDKLEILSEKITFQEKLINILDNHVEINSIYNFSDENLKLHDYKLLREYTENIQGMGAYFSIEKGSRVYSFDSVDGFLVPIWRGISTHTQYPDHTRKKKIIIQEDIILQQELQKYNINRKIGNLLLWGLIVNTIMFGLLLWGGLNVLEKNQNIEDKINGPALQCVEYTAKISRMVAEAYENGLFSQEEERKIQGVIKEVKPTNIG